MKKMNDKEWLDLIGDTEKHREGIQYARDNDTNTTDQIGLYYPNKGEFHQWGITPSSEDKGYCSW